MRKLVTFQVSAGIVPIFIFGPHRSETPSIPRCVSPTQQFVERYATRHSSTRGLQSVTQPLFCCFCCRDGGYPEIGKLRRIKSD